MSTPLEHNYIGLVVTPSMERSCDQVSSPISSILSSEDENNSSLNLKETELRLGLPGCESPEKKSGVGISLFGKDLQNKHNAFSVSTPFKNLVAGVKRGFSDTIVGSSSEKWLFSEVDMGKGAALFSPRGEKIGSVEKPLILKDINNTQKENTSFQSVKEVGIVPQSEKMVQEKKPQVAATNEQSGVQAAKAQVVGWPPIRSFRKNSMVSKNSKEGEEKPGVSSCVYVKVSMDGAPYLRKVDLKTYTNYIQLSSALEKMFSCFTIGQCSSGDLTGKDGLSESAFRDLLHGSDYVLTYEDKDRDWMLVGDVPWEMFTESCKRLRIMKGSEAIGLAPKAMEKSRSQN